MRKTNCVLIICRDLKSVNGLSRFIPTTKDHYILASDDPRVHEVAKEYSWITDICWIEKMESIYSVADDVVHLTKVVNNWLKSLTDPKKGFPKELLFFTRYAEGGLTTQRIQDLLLLIRSYNYIFETYKINSVRLICSLGMDWEDDVLIESAKSKNIAVKVVGGYSLDVLINRVITFLKIYAIAIYYAFNVFRINFSNRLKDKQTKADKKEIVFQLCSSAYKHVENIVPLMKALKERKYNPVALCWHSNERFTRRLGADLVRMEDLKVEELERWNTFYDLLRSIYSLLFTWKKAKRKKYEFLEQPAFSYQLVPIGVQLWPSIRYFIFTELPQTYRIRQALMRYFELHAPVAIKLWGAISLKEGYLAWKHLNTKNRPLIFFYKLGAYIDWPYEEDDNPIDLLFVAGEYHRKMAVKLSGLSPESIISSGQARYESIVEFKKKYSKEKSRKRLNIPLSYKTYIFLDTGYIIRGFLTTHEQVTIAKALLRFASEHSSIALILKPHPCHKTGILDSLVEGSALDNAFLIDKNMLPYHALNAADMLITKLSTMAVEAMLFECPVVCCILDGEQRYNLYEDATYNLDEVEKLEVLLHKLVTDNNFKRKWNEENIQKQKMFLLEYFSEICEQPSVYQARILDEHIRKSNINYQ